MIFRQRLQLLIVGFLLKRDSAKIQPKRQEQFRPFLENAPGFLPIAIAKISEEWQRDNDAVNVPRPDTPSV